MARRPKLEMSGNVIPGIAEYRFKIDAFTPDTIPMARLAEYMAKLAELLGETPHVHFKRLEKGSTVLVQRIDRESVPKVRQRANSVRRAEGPPDAQRAYKALNKLLHDDNATGQLREEKAKATVLLFPGRLEEGEQFTSIRQHGSIDGRIIRIGGKDDTIHITLDAEGQQISGCVASRELAKEMGHVLFDEVRLFGRGKWSRDAEGSWSLEEFKIESFEVLQEESLSNAIKTLREIPTEWADEAYEELQTIRHGRKEKRNGGH